LSRDDTIRMAREAGLLETSTNGYDVWYPDNLERFASLVAAAEREKFCAVLRQLHDSYSLQSDPSTFRTREQA
jgi:hypothetical protein